MTERRHQGYPGAAIITEGFDEPSILALPTSRGMRVIVCGSRGWQDRQKIADRLFDLPVESTIVHGAAKGADRMAHQEAEKLGLLVEPHPADWGKHGKVAGPYRNATMAALGADLCLAFWDGRSNGTRDMMDRADTHGIPVEVVWKS